MGTRSKAKKEADTWKAVAEDMKKKGPGAISDYYSGSKTPPPPRRAPKPPTPKKPKASTKPTKTKKPKAPTPKPRNKRTGQDYLDTTRSMAGQIARRQRSPVPQRRPKK